MSLLQCPVVEVVVESHPDADRLEVARVGGYQLVIAKGSFRGGDRAVYLPESAVLPDSLIEELGLVGRLAGAKANRVKAVRLRGVVSQGLLVPLDSPHLETLDGRTPELGEDCSLRLGVVKYVPPIPVQMQGLVEACAWPSDFDVESWQAHPDVLRPGEAVRVTEKLHGTLCLLGCHPTEGSAVANKGMLGKTRFTLDAAENDANLYVRAWRRHSDLVSDWCETYGESIQVLGEIVGPKVQDLRYGLTEPTFMAFGVRAGGEWLSPPGASATLEALDIPGVPVVDAAMPFDHEAVLEMAQQPSMLDGGLREGVVVAPVAPRRDLRLGRVILKYVNPAYLLRKGGTEHN